jgi:hypothetical protein
MDKDKKYLLNNPGRLEPVLLFSATNYTNFTNFPLFFVLIREIRGRYDKNAHAQHRN